MKVVEKFRGCLLGGLIGDCLGEPFEFDFILTLTLDQRARMTLVTDFITKKLEVKKSTSVVKILPYTDDTEMAISVAESLIINNGFNAEDMAMRFTDEFFKVPKAKRGYGASVGQVFRDIRAKKYKDIYDPSRGQFDGCGSLGNGAAMRTHPVALFCYKKSQDELFDICRKQAQLTHYHMDGYNAAILQTLAVRCALEANPDDPFDSQAFLDKLYNSMKLLEKGRKPDPKYPSLCSQIKKLRKFLAQDLSPAFVGENLGNIVTATESVPTAIYAFLKGMEPLKDYQNDNPFLRTLYLSIAVGGDTDTIACMACSLSGAFYGTSSIPEVLHQQCESSEDISKQADRMATLVGILET